MSINQYIPQINLGIAHLLHSFQAYLILIIGYSAYRLLPVFGYNNDGLEIVIFPFLVIYFYSVLRYYTGLHRLSKVELNPQYNTKIRITKAFLTLNIILLVTLLLVGIVSIYNQHLNVLFLYILISVVVIQLIVNIILLYYTFDSFNILVKSYDLKNIASLYRIGIYLLTASALLIVTKHYFFWQSGFQTSEIPKLLIVADVITEVALIGIFCYLSKKCSDQLDLQYSKNINLGSAINI